MGRIKTKQMKRLSLQLMREYKESFTQTYDENKKIVERHLSGPSKKIRNVVAGYVTRLMKVKEDY